MSYAPPPPQGYYPRTSTTAIISLISGIASWFLLPLLGALIAVITGHMAKGEIKNSNGQVTGDGMATAGLVLGYLNLALGVCGCLAIAIMLALGVISIPLLNSQNFY